MITVIRYGTTPVLLVKCRCRLGKATLVEIL
jgi:hypothetical protein